ncbi:MAG: HAD family phosphatase [Alphaproteobacteria bacterium]|nr:HAD family phosphatase [Alphaproteobacteria bacterium]
MVLPDAWFIVRNLWLQYAVMRISAKLSGKVNMKKLIIWDYDGTIADSEKLWIPVWVETLKKEKNLYLSEEETFNLMVGIADREKKINLEKHFPGLLLDDAFMKKVEEGYIYNEIHCMELIDGVKDVMQDEQFAHCIATGADRKQHTRKTAKFQWLKKYDSFTVDMVKHGKPAPDLFLLAAEKEGYKKEDCIVIGDSLNDFRAADAAGMQSIAFVGGDGNNTPQYRQKCIDAGVVAVCATMKEVKQVLNNFANGVNLLKLKDSFPR